MAEPDPEKPTRESMSGKWEDLKGVSAEGRKWIVDRMLRQELREVLHIALQEIGELNARSKAMGHEPPQAPKLATAETTAPKIEKRKRSTTEGRVKKRARHRSPDAPYNELTVDSTVMTRTMTKSAETPPVPVEKHKQPSRVESPQLGALEVPFPVSAMKRKRSSPEPRLGKRVTHHKSDKIPTIDLTSEPAVTKRPKAKSAEIQNVKEEPEDDEERMVKFEEPDEEHGANEQNQRDSSTQSHLSVPSTSSMAIRIKTKQTKTSPEVQPLPTTFPNLFGVELLLWVSGGRNKVGDVNLVIHRRARGQPIRDPIVERLYDDLKSRFEEYCARKKVTEACRNLLMHDRKRMNAMFYKPHACVVCCLLEKPGKNTARYMYIRHGGELMQTADDRCIKYGAPCGYIHKHGPKYYLTFVPLPAQLREGKKWRDLGFWVRN